MNTDTSQSPKAGADTQERPVSDRMQGVDCYLCENGTPQGSWAMSLRYQLRDFFFRYFYTPNKEKP